jgi:ribosome biogenesis GTPase A
MYYEMNIQWFPGHMTKAMRMVAENIKMVDAVCEIIDARIPFSSRNPDLDEMTAGKRRMVILNRADQADPAVTAEWSEHFASRGLAVLETDSRSGQGVSAFPRAVKEILADIIELNVSRGQAGRKLRLMVLGIPNVGKSSFINRLAKRRAAEAADRPGVTRGKQWIRIDKSLELLDTPGILWPKFKNQTVGCHLAFTGAINDEILDRETLAANLLCFLRDRYPENVKARYKIEFLPGVPGFELLEAIGRKRGFMVSGGEVDISRASIIILDEFRSGKLGRISLENPSDMEILNAVGD